MTQYLSKIGTGANGEITQADYIESSDSLVIVGNFNEFSGHSADNIVLLNSDGTINRTFAENVIDLQNFGIQQLLALPENNLLLIGEFQDYQDNEVISLMCIHQDGSINHDFMSNIGFGTDKQINSGVFCPNIQKIFLFGNFSSFNNYETSGIAVLNLDGSPDLNTMANFTSERHDISVYNSICLPGDRLLLTGSGIAVLETDGFMNQNFLENIGNGKFTDHSRAVSINDYGILLFGNIFSFNNYDVPGFVYLDYDGYIDKNFIHNVDSCINGILTNSFHIPGSGILLTGEFDNQSATGLPSFLHIGYNGLPIDSNIQYLLETKEGYSNTNIESFTQLPDNSVLVAGNTASDNNQIVGYINRLKLF